MKRARTLLITLFPALALMTTTALAKAPSRTYDPVVQSRYVSPHFIVNSDRYHSTNMQKVNQCRAAAGLAKKQRGKVKLVVKYVENNQPVKELDGCYNIQ